MARSIQRTEWISQGDNHDHGRQENTVGQRRRGETRSLRYETTRRLI